MGPSTIISGITAFISWIVLSFSENAITDACFMIIVNSADSVSQSYPAASSLFHLIVLIIAIGSSIAFVSDVMRGLRLN